MNNDVQQDASCCLFQFEGELRADHVEGLCDLVLASPATQARHVLIDCQRVTRFDEAALEALVDFQQCVSQSGGKVMVVGVGHPQLKHVIFLEENGPQPQVNIAPA